MTKSSLVLLLISDIALVSRIETILPFVIVISLKSLLESVSVISPPIASKVLLQVISKAAEV